MTPNETDRASDAALLTSDAPPDVADYHLDTLAADVVALGYGVRRFHLVGYDWGRAV